MSPVENDMIEAAQMATVVELVLQVMLTVLLMSILRTRREGSQR